MSDRTLCSDDLFLAVHGRDEADRLLRRLISDRHLSEQRCAVAGRHDPLKKLRGRSALDQAIASTREIIERMDDLLCEITALGPEPSESGDRFYEARTENGVVTIAPASIPASNGTPVPVPSIP